jgi:hypothetical protein
MESSSAKVAAPQDSTAPVAVGDGRVDVRVHRVMHNGFQIGCVARREYWYGAGWQYVPGNCRQEASRKLWPTPESAIKGRVPNGATLEPVQ